MTNTPRDGAAVRVPPPLVYIATILLGVALERWVWDLPLPLPPDILHGAMILAVILGVVTLLAALGLFWRSGQDPEPWKPTPEVLSHGIYRYSRNPMYVGMALLQAAAAFHRQSGWLLVLVPVSLGVVYLVAVRHEEAYLERKFGARYREYKQAVRRWL